MIPESDVGVNDCRAPSFSVSTRAESRGIFEELQQKDEIFDDALFWNEVRKAADLRRRLPCDDDSTDAVVDD